MPSYSSFLGDVGSGALSNLYYPHADRGIDLVFEMPLTASWAELSGIGPGFLLKRITSNVPGNGN